MSLETVVGVESLLEQLESYADKGLGALGSAQQEIQQLTERVTQLEAKLEALVQQINQPLTLEFASPLLVTLKTNTSLKTEMPIETAAPVEIETPAPLDALNPQERLKHWIKTYPKAFMPNQPQPLKVGIHEEILAAEGGDLKKIRRALAGYVKVPRYLRCMKKGAARLDLQGSHVGLVNEEEAGFAQAHLQTLEQQKQQREAQKAQQQTEQAERLETDRLHGKLSALMQQNTR